MDAIPEEYKPQKCKCGKKDLTEYVVRINDANGDVHQREECVAK